MALGPPGGQPLPHRLAFFDSELRPLLVPNFYREYDRTGALEDNFWKLDLPFLLLFVGEFAWRWRGAVRRGGGARRGVFPPFPPVGRGATRAGGSIRSSTGTT